MEITQNVHRRARNLTDVKGKTPLTDETSAKAVVYMNRRSYVSSSINAIKRNVSDFSKTTDVDMLCSRGTDEIDTHFNIADKKQKKRRRDREPSRVSMKRIAQFMKKRKTRYKLKVIIRKYIPKSSRLYSFATDYKLCYIFKLTNTIDVQSDDRSCDGSDNLACDDSDDPICDDSDNSSCDDSDDSTCDDSDESTGCSWNDSLPPFFP